MAYEDEILNRMIQPQKRGLGTNIARFGSILATGKPPEEDTSALDNLIKYNQIQTGSPEFKMKEAQVRLNMQGQAQLDIEDAKRNIHLQRAKEAGYVVDGGAPQQTPQSGSSFGVTKEEPNVPMNPQNSPMGTMDNTKPQPRILTPSKPAQPKWDATIGAMVMQPAEQEYINNPDYLSPDKQFEMEQDKQANQRSVDMIRDSAQQNLDSIKEAKKGSRYFGPLGELPSIAAPENLLGLNTKGYGERATWEANINQLLSRKVVDLITQMKSASKTGATGFGQLSEKEGTLLREASTALNKKLPEQQALHYLNELEKINKRILSGGQSSNIPTFDSEQEAESSGYKGEAIIAGKETTIS